MNLHPNTNYKHKSNHNSRISSSVCNTYKTKRLSDCIIKMSKDGVVKYALNGSDVARLVGCSRQHVYQVLSLNPLFKSWKTACGWKLELVNKKEVAQSHLRQAIETHIEIA